VTQISGKFCRVSPQPLTLKFLSNHALALMCIADDRDKRIRDIAHDLQITERSAQRIVGELVQSGYLERDRIGRRNRYVLADHLPVSLPVQERVISLSSLLGALASAEPPAQPSGEPL
jgi:DNA-binding MarR family transcriptional regulator